MCGAAAQRARRCSYWTRAVSTWGSVNRAALPGGGARRQSGWGVGALHRRLAGTAAKQTSRALPLRPPGRVWTWLLKFWEERPSASPSPSGGFAGGRLPEGPPAGGAPAAATAAVAPGRARRATLPPPQPPTAALQRTYIFEGVRPFQQAWRLAPKRVLAFYQMPGGGLVSAAGGGELGWVGRGADAPGAPAPADCAPLRCASADWQS